MERTGITVIGLYGMSALFALRTLPQIGETVRGNGLVFEYGGKGFNQAISALRMGRSPVRFITAVGNDAFGEEARKQLSMAGFESLQVYTISEDSTAFAAVCNDECGQNIVIVHGGACDHLTPSHIELMEDTIKESGILLTQMEIPLETVMCALSIAKKHGVYTILNPAPAQPLDKYLLRNVDLLTPNWGEACSIANMVGVDTKHAHLVAQRLKDLGCKNVIITMGSQGAFVSDEDGNSYKQEPMKIKCIDSTGAGDTFSGALAASMARGLDMRESVKLATAASALCVNRQGVVVSIPTLSETLEYFDFTPYT